MACPAILFKLLGLLFLKQVIVSLETNVKYFCPVISSVTVVLEMLHQNFLFVHFRTEKILNWAGP